MVTIYWLLAEGVKSMVASYWGIVSNCIDSIWRTIDRASRPQVRDDRRARGGRAGPRHRRGGAADPPVDHVRPRPGQRGPPRLPLRPRRRPAWAGPRPRRTR